MTNISLDFSQRTELFRTAEVVSDVLAIARRHAVAPLVTGAFARDLHVFYAHGIPTVRQTDDVDFAMAVADWSAFARLKQDLVETRAFQAFPHAAHRLRHPNGLPIDLVPFDGVENANREIRWPPGGDVRMDVFGFREALGAAVPMILPGGVAVPVVSLPALALLKIITWQARHYVSPRKDAHDLSLIVFNYIDLGNADRLFSEFLPWTQAADFDVTQAGARMLGVDIGRLLDRAGTDRVAAIIAAELNPEAPIRLPKEMNSYDPDKAALLLAALLAGLTEARP